HASGCGRKNVRADGSDGFARAPGRDDFSLTFVPAAVSIWLGRKLAEKENVFMRAAKRFYVPLLDRTLRKRGLILSGAVIVLALSFALFTRLGGEFIPTLDEGDLGLEIYRVVGTGMDQAVK